MTDRKMINITLSRMRPKTPNSIVGEVYDTYEPQANKHSSAIRRTITIMHEILVIVVNV